MKKTRPYQICTKCIMDTTDPDIVFNEQGVCNHCIDFEENTKKRWFPNEQGKQKLDAIIAKIKKEGKNKEYDCILGLSGGVDSSYVAYVAKKEFGLRLLAVHVDAGWNSELAVRNIENIVKKLKIDLYTHVVDWEEVKDLQVSFLKASISNQDVPQDHAYFAALYAFAVKNNLRYVLSGGNLATESIMPEAWGYNAMDLRHLMSIHKMFGSRKLRTFPRVNFFQYYVYYPYIKRMTVIRPLNFMPYDKTAAIKVLEKELDFKYYGGKHYESRFTKWQQAHYMPSKFGFEERRAYLSSLVVSGQITRQEALNEINKAVYTPQELKEDSLFVMKKLGLSEQEFNDILARPPKTFADYPSNERLFDIKDDIKRFLNILGIKPKSR